MVLNRVLVLATIFGTAVTANGQEYRVTDDWTMEIIPAAGGAIGDTAIPDPSDSGVKIIPVGLSVQESVLIRDAAHDTPLIAEPMLNPPAPDSAKDAAGAVNAADYARVYQSIPFNRAEYNANPTYRHDAAMELLTGNARHQTIVRHSSTTQRQPAPQRQVPAPVPYRYNNRRWGLNYYFYFPYWNFRGLY